MVVYLALVLYCFGELLAFGRSNGLRGRHDRHLPIKMADEGLTKAEINAIFKRLKSVPANRVRPFCPV